MVRCSLLLCAFQFGSILAGAGAKESRCTNSNPTCSDQTTLLQGRVESHSFETNDPPPPDDPSLVKHTHRTSMEVDLATHGVMQRQNLTEVDDGQNSRIKPSRASGEHKAQQDEFTRREMETYPDPDASVQRRQPNSLAQQGFRDEPRRLLFVFATYIPDDFNCELFKNATMSTSKFHQDDAMVLVVDNESPLDVAKCMASMGHQPWDVLRGASLNYEPGTWRLVQQQFDKPDSVLSKWNPSHVVLLQHDILLTRALDPKRLPCPVVSLAHDPRIRDLDGLAHMGISSDSMGWASQVAECMDIHCSDPCSQRGPVSEKPVLHWGIAEHSAIMFSIDQWRRLKEIGFWGCLTDAQFSKKQSIEFERVSGILMAKLGYPTVECIATHGEFVLKAHGHTYLLQSQGA